MVKHGQLTKKDAAKRLYLSYRQLRRVYNRYINEGDEGLIHKSRGKPSSNAYPIDRFENQLLQIQKSSGMGIRPKQQITLKKHLNGKITLWHKGQKIPYCYVERKAKEETIKLGHDILKCRQHGRRSKSKSPWSQFNPGWLKQTKEHLLTVT